MTAASPGTAGPHPDLTALIAASLNAVGQGETVPPAQLTVLQQRTLGSDNHPTGNVR